MPDAAVLRRLTASEVSEALWEAQREYGIEMTVSEQAAVARWLAREAAIRNPRRRFVTRLDVLKALRHTSLQRVPGGFGASVERRLRRVFAIEEHPHAD